MKALEVRGLAGWATRLRCVTRRDSHIVAEKSAAGTRCRLRRNISRLISPDLEQQNGPPPRPDHFVKSKRGQPSVDVSDRAGRGRDTGDPGDMAGACLKRRVVAVPSDPFSSSRTICSVSNPLSRVRPYGVCRLITPLPTRSAMDRANRSVTRLRVNQFAPETIESVRSAPPLCPIHPV